jgi:hypothetical protein
MVVAAGPPATATVLARQHINLADSGPPHTVQPYHAARGLPLGDAETAIARAAARARERASDAIREALAAHGGGDRCGLGLDPPWGEQQLAALLASHSLVHAAEGRLFRRSIAEAATACGLRVVSAPERELYPRTAAALGTHELSLRRLVVALGESHGAPWREDEKLATVAALLALAAE